jgi:hypothetical protein
MNKESKQGNVKKKKGKRNHPYIKKQTNCIEGVHHENLRMDFFVQQGIEGKKVSIMHSRNETFKRKKKLKCMTCQKAEESLGCCC